MFPQIRRKPLLAVPKASGSSAAPAAAADWHLPGPLVVRWALAAHQFYDTAKQSWAPFDAIHAADPAIPDESVDSDKCDDMYPQTRFALAM